MMICCFCLFRVSAVSVTRTYGIFDSVFVTVVAATDNVFVVVVLVFDSVFFGNLEFVIFWSN